MSYLAADDRYDSCLPPLRAQRPAAAGALARPLAELRRRPAVRRQRARSCAARSTSASRTSTSRTTTARRTAPPRRTSAACCARTSAVSRRARHLDQGRLRHVAGAVRRRRSRKYLLASLDQSLGRMGLDYVDIFYSHRLDPDTPLEETMGALDTAVRRARRSTPASRPTAPSARARRGASCASSGTPLLIHQPSYSHAQPLDRGRAARRARGRGVGCIAFSPLAQGLLTDKYLDGIPEGARMRHVRLPDASGCSPTTTSSGCAG